MEKNFREEKGITLIALVITIIVLIILAGVAINLTLGDNGIFNKAKLSKEKYNEESIREKVEIGIMELEIDELTLGNQITIESVLQELLEKRIFETIDKDTAVGNIGEYEVKLKYNEQGKVAIEYIVKATGVRVTYKLNPESYTNGEKVSILLTVNGKVKSVTKPDNLVIYPKNNIVAINYQVTANGTYKFVIEDEAGNKQEKNVIVDIIDRLNPNDFEVVSQSVGLKINITQNATDAESDGISVKSGIERYEYFVKGESDSEYIKYETNEIEVNDYGTYSVYAIAYDKAGNYKQSSIKNVTVDLPDTLAPKEFTPTVSDIISSTELQINAKTEDQAATQTDSCSGIKGYEYYVYENEQVVSKSDIINENTYIATNLIVGNEYKIFVKAYDNAGNVTETVTINYTKLEVYKWAEYSATVTRTYGYDTTYNYTYSVQHYYPYYSASYDISKSFNKNTGIFENLTANNLHINDMYSDYFAASRNPTTIYLANRNTWSFNNQTGYYTTTVTKFTSKLLSTEYEKKDELRRYVTSTNPDAYPENGGKGNYWYEKVN